MKNFLIVLALFGLLSCTSKPTQEETPSTAKEEWISLFNGKDMSDWTPKFAGSELGINYKNTFRVEDGLMKVVYDEWESFDGEFGHLFYNKKSFSHYILHMEYRFVGDQVTDGPGWAIKNNGAMLHCQDPATMTVEQDFPVSIEGQLLGGYDEGSRPTGNLCTPGTHVHFADTLFTPHCISSSSETYSTEDWVNADFVVYGDSIIHHIIEGDTVLTYTKPIREDNGEPVKSGYISIQAESAPIHFRKIELKELK